MFGDGNVYLVVYYLNAIVLAVANNDGAAVFAHVDARRLDELSSVAAVVSEGHLYLAVEVCLVDDAAAEIGRVERLAAAAHEAYLGLVEGRHTFAEQLVVLAVVVGGHGGSESGVEGRERLVARRGRLDRLIGLGADEATARRLEHVQSGRGEVGVDHDDVRAARVEGESVRSLERLEAEAAHVVEGGRLVEHEYLLVVLDVDGRVVGDDGRGPHERELPLVVGMRAADLVEDATRAGLEHLDGVVEAVADEHQVALLARVHADRKAEVEVVGALELSAQARYVTLRGVVAEVYAEHVGRGRGVGVAHASRVVERRRDGRDGGERGRARVAARRSVAEASTARRRPIRRSGQANTSSNADRGRRTHGAAVEAARRLVHLLAFALGARVHHLLIAHGVVVLPHAAHVLQRTLALLRHTRRDEGRGRGGRRASLLHCTRRRRRWH